MAVRRHALAVGTRLFWAMKALLRLFALIVLTPMVGCDLSVERDQSNSAAKDYATSVEALDSKDYKAVTSISRRVRSHSPTDASYDDLIQTWRRLFVSWSDHQLVASDQTLSFAAATNTLLQFRANGVAVSDDFSQNVGAILRSLSSEHDESVMREVIQALAVEDSVGNAEIIVSMADLAANATMHRVAIFALVTMCQPAALDALRDYSLHENEAVREESKRGLAEREKLLENTLLCRATPP